jgi:hypothetical protein
MRGAITELAWTPMGTLLAILLVGCNDKGDDSSGGGNGDDSGDIVTDVDADGFPLPDDCDDDDAEIHPEASELCDGVDNDCNGDVDDDPVDAVTYFTDADGDGYGAGKGVASCETVAGSVENGEDCDDTLAEVNPDAAEVCDDLDVDEDCDSLVDDDDDSLDASTATTLYADTDGDSYGDAAVSITSCGGLAGYVAVADDCDDANAKISPAAEEICGDDIDNNCDLTAEGCEWIGEVHESDAHAELNGAPVMYGNFGMNLTGLDANGDGVGDLAVGTQSGDYAALFSGPIAGTSSVESGATAKLLPEVSTSDDLGTDVQSVGDQDGDGYDDLVVQALWYPGGDAYGRSYLLLGPISGEDSVATTASATFTGLEAGDQLGYSPASGDVNGDGVPDILQGVPWGNEVRGAAYLFLGPVTTGDLTPDDADAAWFGLAEYDWVGADISANGDIDGDGIDDIALGAAQTDTPFENGAVWIFYGPVTGDHLVDEADVYIGGAEEQSYMAPSTIGGDLDADGRDDIAVGGPHLDHKSPGHVWVFYADSVPAKGELDVAKADATITAESTSDEVGSRVDSAGDLDADGIDDLVVSSYVASLYLGVVWGYYGPVSGTLSSDKDSSFRIEGDVDHALGSSVGLQRDLTGDGLDDLAVGAFFAKPNGKAFVFEGRNGL